jgi:hypothetical protein
MWSGTRGVCLVKKRSVALWGTVAVLVALVLLLPVFLSSGLVRTSLLDRLNAGMPGTLTTGSCSIGWQQGLRCTDLVYHDAATALRVTIPRLSGSQGLLALAVAPMNLGTITLVDPLVVLPPSAPAHKPVTRAPEEQQPRAQQPPAAKKTAAVQERTRPWWDRLSGKLIVSGATLNQSTGGKEDRSLLRNGSFSARLVEGSVHFEAAMESAGNSGSATASGFVNLPARAGSLLDTLVTETSLHVMDLQLEPFFALLPDSITPSRGTGELSAEMLVRMSGLDDLTARGTVMARNLQLSGGVLGEDRPTFSQVNLDIDARRRGPLQWEFPDLQLSADFGTMQLKGSADGQEMSLEGKGRLDLPVLFGQFPHLLRVQPGMELQNGTMDVSLLMTRDRQRLDAAVDAGIRDISGTTGDHGFTWNSPVNCSLSGFLADSGPMISSLKIKAPFLDLEGEGDLKTFSLDGSADLGLMLEEVGTLFDLGWNGDGKVRLKAASKEESPGRFAIDTRIDISDFTLSRQGKTVLPAHPFTLTGRLTTPAGMPQSRGDAAGLRFELNAWPGTVSGTIGELYRQRQQLTGSYQLQADLELVRLSDLLHNTGLSADTTLAGSLQLAAAGYADGKTVVLRELDARIAHCIFYRQGTMFRDPSVRLQLVEPRGEQIPVGVLHPLVVAANRTSFFADTGDSTLVNLDTRRMYAHGLRVVTEKGRLEIGSLAVADWQRLPGDISLHMDGTADLDRLMPLLHRAAVLPKDRFLGGAASFTIDLQPDSNGSQAGSLQLAVTDPAVTLGETKLPLERELSARLDFQGNLMAGDLVFDPLQVRSGPLELQGSGKLQQSGKAPFFSLSGNMTPDFAVLARMVSSLAALDIQGSGGSREPFNLLVPLATAGAANTSLPRFSTLLKGERLAAVGVELDQPAMPVSLADGVLQADLTARANGGRLKFSPRVDLTAVPPEVILPDNEQVLDHVGISPPLVEGLLRHIHPVLGLLARPSGSIGARVNSFSWPLVEDGSRLAEFSAVLEISRVNLVARGVLQEVLDMMKLGDEPLALRQSEISCKGARGRISCTPLEITVAGSEMTLAGSIGFDGSIDYLLKVPVTEHLVGKEGYRVLQGTTLKVPIKGNRDQAVFDRRALADAVTDLLVQAGTRGVSKALQEQAEKVLPGLIDGLLGN